MFILWTNTSCFCCHL
ncbi:hypothetical protein VN97_g11070, partial [Penicillium thymicola]